MKKQITMKKIFTLLLMGFLMLASTHINAQIFTRDEVNNIQKEERASSPYVIKKQYFETSVKDYKANVLLSEDFESGVIPPTDWSIVDNDGDGKNWTQGTPSTSHSGNYCAVSLSYDDYGNISPDNWLISPQINIPSTGVYALKFWISAGDPSFAEEKYGVFISTINTDTSSFSEIHSEVLTNNVYKVIVLSLEDYVGQSIYIAFRHWDCMAQLALLLDDIVVNEVVGPEIQGSTTLDFGSMLDLDPAKQKSYAITNTGIGDLVVSASTTSPEITLGDLPVTIAPGQSANITVTFNPNTAGEYSGSFVLETNDPNSPEFAVQVQASVQAARVTDYFLEDFEQGPPVGWNAEYFYLFSFDGINNSHCYSLWTLDQPNQLTTHFVKMGAAPVLNFHYKAEKYSTTHDGAPSPPEEVTLRVFVSKDFGATFTQVYEIGPNGDQAHDVSYDYAEINLDLSAYANDTCLIRFSADRLGNSYPWNSIFIDNVSVGTNIADDLAAVGIQGNSIPVINTANTYTVSVKNTGSETQSDYTVKLMQEGDIEIASVPGISIAKDEIKTFDLTWTPTTEGHTFLYSQVVLAGDENESNNQTNNLDIAVQPVDITTITIGTISDTLVSLPIDFYYKEGASQTLYLASELGGVNGGNITSIRYLANNNVEFHTAVIKVWVGETDKTDFADGQWVDPSGLTKVFENTLIIPAGTNVDFTIPFSSPYVYHGGNLVVYMVRQDNHYLQNKSFYGTKKIARSLLNTSDNIGSISSENPGTGQIKDMIPITTLTITKPEIGELNGVVSDNEGVVEGAKVKVLGTQLFAATDVNGTYSFPSLIPGTYSIEVSKHGYYTKTVDNIIIEGNAVQSANVMLDKLSRYTVEGTISDIESNTGIEGAMVRLMGYDNYKAMTNADGSFIISDVYGGSDFKYDVAVSAPYYESKTGTVTVDADVSGLDFVLTEIPYPVHSVSATATEGYSTISWKEPLPEFRYDNGINKGDFGWDAGIASEKSVMGSVHGHHAIINEISWFLTSNEGPHQSVNLFLFDLDEQGKPTKNILYSVTNVPNTDMVWNTYELPTPVETPNGFMVAISYSGYMGLGDTDPDDQYPLEFGMHYFTDDYETKAFDDLANYYNKHLMIRAIGEDLGEVDYNTYSLKSISNTTPKVSSNVPVLTSNVKPFMSCAPSYKSVKNSNAKSFGNYSVYRLTEGQAQSEWTLVADDVTALTVTDVNWETIDPGIYQYAVVANYSLTSSEPRLSNSLLNKMELQYTVNLITGSESPINGAVVKLTNADSTSKHYVYTSTTNTNSVVFPAVYRGSYTLSVTLAGYELYVQDVQIDAEGSHNAQLSEIIVKPYGLQVTETESPKNVEFSWDGGSFFDNFESYEDFSISHIGDFTMIDGDEISTSGISNIEYANEYYVGSYMVFNPYQTTPSLIDYDYYRDIAEPYSGNKFLACFSARHNLDFGNNDWLILPKMKVYGGTALKFMAKSATADYGLDRIKIGISKDGTDQSDFTFIQSGDYTEVPAKWTEYSFDLSEYADSEVYVAINCVSDGFTFMLMLDDIYCGMDEYYGASVSSGYNIYLNGTEVATNVQTTDYTFTGLENGDYTAGVKAVYGLGVSEMATIDFTVTGTTGIDENSLENLMIYPNPFSDRIFISDPSKVKRVTIVNVIGEVVKDVVVNGNSVSTDELAKGVYMISVESSTGDHIVRKFIKK